MALGGPIPVTVGTVETRRKHEEPKVTTVTRMAALRRQIRRQLQGSRPRGDLKESDGSRNICTRVEGLRFRVEGIGFRV